MVTTTGGGALLLLVVVLAMVVVPAAAVAVALLIAVSGKRGVSTNTHGNAAETSGPLKDIGSKPGGIGWRRWALLLWGFAGAAVSGGGWLYIVQRRGRLGSLTDPSNLDSLLSPFGLIAGLGFFAGVLVGWMFLAIFEDPIDSLLKRKTSAQHDGPSRKTSGSGA
jgi:hypothetical protein